MNPGKDQFGNEQQSIDNPDDFLSLHGPDPPGSHSEKVIERAPPNLQNNIKESQPAQKIQSTFIPIQPSLQKPLLVKQYPKIKKGDDYDPSKVADQHKKKKRIKKSKASSSDQEESFGLLKQRKKASSKPSSQNRAKKQSQHSNRGRGKPRGRGKGITSVQEIKRELQELKVQQHINVQDKPGEKANVLNKKLASPTEMVRQEYQPTIMNWQADRDREQQQMNSMQAELCEDSCMHRMQSHTYRKIVQLINQEGDNIIKRISELPFILY